MTEPIDLRPLEYAQPAAKPYSVKLARAMRRVAYVPSAVGVLILAGFACTGWSPFVLMGLIWLYVGGAIGFVTGVTALVFFVLTNADRERNAEARKAYGRAVLLCLLTVFVAIACVVLGAMLVSVWEPDFD